jgi:hypothetical protein
MEVSRTTPARIGVMAALDAIAVEVMATFESAGIPALLLKGASIRLWLYDSAEERVYDDIDLLVRDSQLGQAERTLRGEAFRFVHDDDHGQVWQRGPVNVDLHRRLTGAKAPPDQVFDRLLAGSEWLELSRGRVRVLGQPARALTLVLHAAQHGSTWESPLRDVKRALERLPRETFEDAAALAGEIGAAQAFAAGLDTLPEGAALRAELGLDSDLRRQGLDPPVTEGIRRLRSTPGARAKGALLVREVFPTRAYLRTHVPLARRGTLGLWLARVVRPFLLLVRLGPALIAARRSGRREPF